MESERQRGIQPKEAQEILADHGMAISEKQAGKLLDFLYRMATLSMKQMNRRSHEISSSLYPGKHG